MEFEKAFLLIVLSLTVWSMCALLMDERGNVRINRGFALLLACMGVSQAYFYSYVVSPPYGHALLGLGAQSVIWLKGPLLLMMVRLVAGESVSGFWRHFLTFPVMLIAMVLLPQWSMEFNIAGFVALLGYLVVALKALGKTQARLGVIYRGYQNSTYYWFLFVITALVVMVAIDLVITLVAYVRRAYWLESMKHVNWMLSVYLIVIAFLSLHRPGVFFRQKDEEATPEVNGALPVEKDASVVVLEKSWRELNESLAQSLAAGLAQLMEQEQLFRKNDLSLGDLAGRLGISVHQASELLNVHLKANFYDYINRYRLAYACDLLRDPKCQWRVLDIAFESGFSNKNSFYRYFREVYQQTPVEYRNRELGLEVA